MGAAGESILLLQLLAVRDAVALMERAVVVVLHHVESTSWIRGGGVLVEGTVVVVETRSALGSIECATFTDAAAVMVLYAIRGLEGG